MSAAFNLVAKEVIIPKLKVLGVGEFAAKLLHSYLTLRKSRTKVKGIYSAWVEVRTGIGEGSVLGPLIFILTIVCCAVVLCRVAQRLRALSYTVTTEDQKDNQIELSSVEFADDVTGLTVCQSEDQVALSLKFMMEEYQSYFSAHGLKINVTKCEHLVLGQPIGQPIYVDGRKEADNVKLLGLSFSKSYKFEKHVDVVTEKIAKRNGQLSKLLKIADQQTMTMLANATVLSIASYGAHVYATEDKQVNRVQVKLNKTMRLVTKSKLSVHIPDLLSKMKWMKFAEVVQWSKIMLLHRVITTSSAPYCKQLLDVSHQSRYAMRDIELKIAWRPRLTRRGFKSFIYSAVKLYNQVKLIGKKMTTATISKFVKLTIKSWR